MKINKYFNLILILVAVFLFYSSAGNARAQTTEIQPKISNFSRKMNETGQQLKGEAHNLRNMIRNLKMQQEQMKVKVDQNKRMLREIRVKNRETQAKVKHQQRDVRAKVRISIARQREQMRRLKDTAGR